MHRWKCWNPLASRSPAVQLLLLPQLLNQPRHQGVIRIYSLTVSATSNPKNGKKGLNYNNAAVAWLFYEFCASVMSLLQFAPFSTSWHSTASCPALQRGVVGQPRFRAGRIGVWPGPCVHDLHSSRFRLLFGHYVLRSESVMLNHLRICFVCMVIFGCIVVGCSREQARQNRSEESFQRLVAQFKEMAAKKMSSGGTITVTDQITADKYPAEAATGTIRVRKQTPGGVAGNVNKTSEVIDLWFVYEAGQWRCSKATSKDFEGDKVTGQHSIGGTDIGLTNLFIWVGL